MTSTLKLVTNGDVEGYMLSNIKKNLHPKQWVQFQLWISGQTVAEYKNELLVYSHDFERFMRGFPPLD